MAVAASTIAIGMTVASVAYSYYKAEEARKQAKKAQRAAEAAQDAAKGQIVSTVGEKVSLSVLYGRHLYGGAQVWHNIKSNYTYAGYDNYANIHNMQTYETTQENTVLVEGYYDEVNGYYVDGYYETTSTPVTNYTRWGSKNEFLFVQQAICHAGINLVVATLVDDQDVNSPKLQYGQYISVKYNGNGANATISANFPERASSVFTNTAYASMVFRLNRDEPQYSGVPNVQFYIEGMRVKDIISETALSSEKTYSNNPARCLLDYLMNPTYGRGLSLDQIDLPSFYYAKQVCDTIVRYNAPVGGDFWKNLYVTHRNIPLYEANIAIGTEASVRDNVVELLATMGDATLVWSAGKYKLKLQYPLGNGAIVYSAPITDDHLIRESVSIKYPSASERINYYTVTYSDEANQFKSNSVSWPPKGSSVHQYYMAQDNNVPLEKSSTENGISDYYHALAKAEELVRLSRVRVTYSFSIKLSGIFYEPGDIVLVNSEVANINNETLEILEVEATAEGTAKITARKFSQESLAWNVSDDQILYYINRYVLVLQPPVNLSISINEEGFNVISWDLHPEDMSDSFIVEVFKNGKWQELGRTSAQSFEVSGLAKGSYTFSVRGLSLYGRLSPKALANLVVYDGTEIPPQIISRDYIVREGTVITTKLEISILSPAISAFIQGYELSYSLLDADTRLPTTWISLGVTSESVVTVNRVIDGRLYKIRARTLNRKGMFSEYSYETHQVVGKTAPPSTVESIDYNFTRTGLRLTWPAVSDIDLDRYEVRVGSSWDNSELVARTVEVFFDINTLKGGAYNYLVKAVDTSKIYSLDSAEISVNVQKPSKPVVNILISGENYKLYWSAVSSIFTIDSYEIYEEGTLKASVKSTEFVAKVNWLNSREFKVRAVDINGNYSDFFDISLNISKPSSPSLRADVVDNNVLLYWTASSGTLPVVSYLVYKDGNFVGELMALFSMFFETNSGTYTYTVKAKDSAGNLSEASEVSAIVNQPPDYILAVDYLSDFSGTKVNMVSDGATGYLLCFDQTRTWNSQFINSGKNSISEFGSQKYILPSIASGYYEEVYDYGTELEGMKIKLEMVSNVVSGNASTLIQIMTSLNNIDWSSYNDGNIVFAKKFRYVKFKISVTLSDTSSILQISKINMRIDAKKIRESGVTYITSPAGVDVLFNNAFKDITSIQLTAGLGEAKIAAYDFVDVPNPVKFKALLFNSYDGTPATGVVSYTIEGY